MKASQEAPHWVRAGVERKAVLSVGCQGTKQTVGQDCEDVDGGMGSGVEGARGEAGLGLPGGAGEQRVGAGVRLDGEAGEGTTEGRSAGPKARARKVAEGGARGTALVADAAGRCKKVGGRVGEVGWEGVL